MRDPREVRELLGTRTERSLATWLAAPDEATVSCPLQPPTAAQALAEPSTVSAWIDAWRQAPPPLSEHVQWEERRWAHLGTQRIPVRWSATGADALVAGAGNSTSQAWRVLLSRVERATELLDGSSLVERGTPTVADQPVALRSAIAVAVASLRTRWVEMPEVDAELAMQAASWFLAHSRSGLRIRQVPLPGIHTKWLQAHRAVVERLVAAARADGSRELGLAPAPDFHDVLVLDPVLRGAPSGDGGALPGPAFPRASRIDRRDLGSLGLVPEVVIVCENAETVQVLPDIPGAVALSGAGMNVPGLLEVPWVQSAPVLYWGDLDADGFRILARARHHHLRVRSVLMDRATFEEHSALAVTGGSRALVELGQLTDAERALHDELSVSGDRLEQERIELGYAERVLREQAAHTQSGGWVGGDSR
ncbi:Wadjet anti-phage system protein JetD domain-containing protein [Brachybacterium sp. AOP25-B2-12]|uniref:Wadjet anti-phage system protein JetD domain-containing protein n=1 Tax=Brachybacterium sp. AOP25-B2-12 TaxID=3457710 RepID=UPI0040339BD9